MKIGVAIPCQKHQIGFLYQCLDSIERQKQKPYLVVISISGCEPGDIPKMNNYTFQLKILHFRQKFNQAENRNIAASLCKYEQCSHISFFDTESIMHPQRIEIIMNIVKEKPEINIILHSYENNWETFKPYSGINVLHNRLQKANSGCAVVNEQINVRIHHSHCTVQTNIWNQVKFREEKEFEQKDNALFCGDVLAIPDIQSIYIENNLSCVIV